MSELPSNNKQNVHTIQSSIEMKPVDAFKNSIEKEVYSNLQDKRQKERPKFQLGQLVRTADIKRGFSKGDSTNCSYKLHTKAEVIHDTIPSYRINHLPESYNQNL